MDLSRRKLLGNILSYGSGEFLLRLFSVTTVILLGHLYGVVMLGVYGLAMSLAAYLVPLIDFGLRYIGARLIARFPGSASDIVRHVQRRRLLMAGLLLPLVAVYAALTRLPFEFKLFVFLFSAIGVLYSLSLDWAAWGREQLLLVGLVKSVVPGCVLLGLLTALATAHLLTWLVVGNLVGYSLQGLVFWIWWRHHRRQISASEPLAVEAVEAMSWRRSGIMGLALLGNMAFNTSDMLILGALSSPQQVGLYSASYRILNQVLITYYLLTVVLYPQFARQNYAQRLRMLRPRIFLLLFASGTLVCIPVILFRRPMLSIIFGHPFVAAAPLLLLLAFCLPLDFLVSYISNAYFAWGMERAVLRCAAIAAFVNILLNLATIARYGAIAAAVNTLISYLVYLAALAAAGTRVLRAQDAPC